MRNITELQTISNTIYKDFPEKLYCANNLQDGLFFTSKQKMLEGLFPYTLVNPTNSYNSIVLDIDYDWFNSWNWDNFPTPNIAVINPRNNHAHLFFYLAVPVHKNKISSQKALSYLSDVSLRMTYHTGADSNFTGYIGKNACYDGWGLLIGRLEPYTLAELQNYFEPVPQSKIAKTITENRVESRNCALFDSVRLWAYKNKHKFTTLDAFSFATNEVAEKLNIQYASPLGTREVAGLVKSISNWVWKKFKTEGEQMAWSTENRKKSSAIRNAKSMEKAKMCFLLKQERYTQQAIAEKLGISRNQVYRLLKVYKTVKKIN